MKRYEEYQLQWMIDHGYSLADFVKALIPCAYEIAFIEPHASLSHCITEGFYDFKNGNGFHGVLWECEAEWKGNEGNEVTGE